MANSVENKGGRPPNSPYTPGALRELAKLYANAAKSLKKAAKLLEDKAPGKQVALANQDSAETGAAIAESMAADCVLKVTSKAFLAVTDVGNNLQKKKR